MKQQQGLALILVLWVVSLLTIMAGSFALTMRREAEVTSDMKTTASSLALAEAGLNLAEMMLLHSDATKKWRADGSVYQINATDVTLRIQLLAETGKIDLNTADENTLKALFDNAPVLSSKVDLVSAIIDWRDPDEQVHKNGAEKKEYQKAGLKYVPRNQPFQSLEEVQLVLGMNEKLSQWLEPYVTIYSGQPKVNLAYATENVLRLLPELSPDAITDYVKLRADSAIKGLPIPPFPKLQADAGANNATNAVADNTLTGAVTVISEAMLSDGSTAVIVAVVEKDDSGIAPPFHILQWQTHPAIPSLFTEPFNALVISEYAEPELNN